MNNYYQILGVSKDADSKTIKSAYRKLAKQYHPDISKEVDAEQKFAKIAEAYDVLSDNTKREQYDNYGSYDTEGFQKRYQNGNYDQGYSNYDPRYSTQFRKMKSFKDRTLRGKLVFIMISLLILFLGIFIVLIWLIFALISWIIRSVFK
jgi:curved DNA-binding protein CbpA